MGGTRIYIRDGNYKYYARDPILNPRTGKVCKWHTLCSIDKGELQARIVLDELLGFTQIPKGDGDFCAWFGEWRKEMLMEREQEAPRDPVRKKIWDRGTKDLMYVLNVIENAFADLDCIQVEPPDIAKFLDQWKGKRAAQLYKGHLNKFFFWACRRGIVKVNPVREVTIDTPKKRKVLMSDQVYIKIKKALLEANEKRKPSHNEVMTACLMDMYYLLYQRGTDVRLLRTTEMDGKEIKFVPTKTENTSGAEVRVIITDQMREVVARAKAVAKLRSIYLFHDKYGQPLDARLVGDIFQRACKRAGVSGYILKDVRSKAASDAKKAGYTEEQIKVALAHTTTDTTRDYIRGQDAPLSEVILTLPE